LVIGIPEKPYAIIDTPIGKSRTDFRKQTTKNPESPKPAITEYKVLEVLDAPTGANIDKLSLLSLKLHTGRTHQIRVHMASIGHPLVGDSLYGPSKQPMKMSRHFLHARKIEVQLPDGTWIEAESELPKDLREVLTNLNSKQVHGL